jgi:hypothetical protein
MTGGGYFVVFLSLARKIPATDNIEIFGTVKIHTSTFTVLVDTKFSEEHTASISSVPDICSMNLSLLPVNVQECYFLPLSSSKIESTASGLSQDYRGFIKM